MISASTTGRWVVRSLGNRLLDAGSITKEDLDAARDRKRKTGEFLGEALIGLGIISFADLKPHLEASTGFPMVDLTEEELDRHVAGLVPESFAVTRRALPFRIDDGSVLVAMADPLNVATIDELRAQLQRPVRPVLALTQDVNLAIRRAFDAREKARVLIDEMTIEEAPRSCFDEMLQQADDAPIVKLVNNIISGAFTSGASDIHLEPQEHSIRVRYRVDGLLYDQMSMPSHYLSACVSRLKILSGLDIAEKRRPQDGRFVARDENGQEYDIRLSTLPTVLGEKACMRLLQKTNCLPQICELGLFPEQGLDFEKMIRKPHGLILVTGPTGSGKTTTLYAGLDKINDPTRNICTVEDPVEYTLPGANQVQVNPKIGLSFANGLRTLVRQDPDVILIGEIRDRETAEIAVQAALTGHLVLSTIHTNDAPSTLVRLQNMGIEPYLIASSVVGIVGQRLLRKVCNQCKELHYASPEVLSTLGIDLGGESPLIARGKGCRRCGGRGTRGRTAAYELMYMTEGVRELILRGCSGVDLMQQAIRDGMVPMRSSAVRKVLDHSTTPEEVLRVFSQDD